MGYSAYGALAAVGLIAVVSAVSAIDRSANYQPAKASVYRIDRTCDIVETMTGPDGSEVTRNVKGSCIEVDEWETVKNKRTRDISGKAVIHVNYTAPQDGSSRTSSLTYDGRDDQFYQLEAGDEIAVLVSNDDPSKIIED